MTRKVVFMGTPDFAVQSLDAIVRAGYEVAAVVTVPDKQSGRGLKINQSPVKEYALEHGLTVLQPEKLRDDSFLSDLQALQADVFVVVAFRMLPRVVWSMPRMGTFNLHASLLPQYRGAAPINWAVMNGETKTGVTTFLLNENIDEGAVLMQCETEISYNDTAETLHDRLALMGSGLVVQTLEALFEGTAEPQAQKEAGALRPAPKIFKQDCAVDWCRRGTDVRNFIRGLSPYPAAYTTFVDEKGREIQTKIFESEFEKTDKATEKTIETDGKKQLKIGVNDGFIRILSLQISGKKRVTIEEFLRGYDVSRWKLI